MFTSSKLRPLLYGHLRALALALILSAILLLAQQVSPKASGLAKYDVTTETKIRGTVDEVRVIGQDAKTQITNLVLKTGSASVEVFLCPKTFLDSLEVTYAKGDKLEITGSKVKRDDLEEVLAREIVKGNDTLVLRDESGNPVW